MLTAQGTGSGTGTHTLGQKHREPKPDMQKRSTAQDTDSGSELQYLTTIKRYRPDKGTEIQYGKLIRTTAQRNKT
jgi:hypothetical protein